MLRRGRKTEEEKDKNIWIKKILFAEESIEQKLKRRHIFGKEYIFGWRRRRTEKEEEENIFA